MGTVNIKYQPQTGHVSISSSNISKLRLAGCYFAIQPAKRSISQIFTALGKAITVYHLLCQKNGRLEKSDEYQTADYTEKRFYSYLLGMATCKWVSEEMFKIPHLQYFSLAKTTTGLQNNITGSTCPDLIGQDKNGQFFIFEAKGTCNNFNPQQVKNGKNQLTNIRIAGQSPVCIVTESYFNNNVFEIYAKDPEVGGINNIEYSSDCVIENYYNNIIQLLKLSKTETDREFRFLHDSYIDGKKSIFVIGINKNIFTAYTNKQYNVIRSIINEETQACETDEKYISSGGISFQIINR